MIAVMLLLACGGADPTPAAAPDPLAGVAWTAPTPATERVLVSLPAEISPQPDGLTALGPPVESRVLAWQVTPGQRVARGDVLAVLDSPSLAGLRAAVDGQRRARDAEQARLDAGVGTRSDVAVADAALARDAATLANAGRVVRAAGGALHWTSPLDGVVQAVRCDQGVLVGPADACLTVAAPERAAVLTHVPERHLAALDGVVARYTGADGRAFASSPLLTREPTVDRASRTLALRFALPPDAGLVPGSSGRVALIVPATTGFTLPEGAITQLEGEAVVFRRAGVTAEPVPVTVLGPGADPQTLVVEGPLSATDAVAWRGVFTLKSQRLLGEPE